MKRARSLGSIVASRLASATLPWAQQELSCRTVPPPCAEQRAQFLERQRLLRVNVHP